MSDLDLSSVTEILRELQTKKYGKYKAIVSDNVDPEKRGRLKIQVEAVFGDMITDWVEGVFPLGGNSNETFVFVPAIGSIVTVEFIGGDVSSPVWTGTYYEPQVTQSESLDEDGSVLSLIRTRSGLEIRIRDDGEKHSIKIATANNAHFHIDEDGNMFMQDENEAGVSINPADKIVKIKGHASGEFIINESKVTASDGDASLEISNGNITLTGKTIKLNGDKVNLGKGANAPLLNARSFLQAFSTHVHTPQPPGPATPPAILEAVKLSKVTGV